MNIYFHELQNFATIEAHKIQLCVHVYTEYNSHLCRSTILKLLGMFVVTIFVDHIMHYFSVVCIYLCSHLDTLSVLIPMKLLMTKVCEDLSYSYLCVCMHVCTEYACVYRVCMYVSSNFQCLKVGTIDKILLLQTC